MDNFKLFNITSAQATKETMPRNGRVNEMCQEWMVREDSAIAYHLQNEEIQQHYTGNKQRNQLVREDFPRARSEQMKEQEMAEQAAAIYHKMLAEQEEIDKQLAEKLAKKLELEEQSKKKAEERIGLRVAKKLQEQEVQKSPPQRPPKNFSYLEEIPQISKCKNQRSSFGVTHNISTDIDATIVEQFAPGVSKTQEEADAEFARVLQEQEGNLEETLLQRDRLLAIEAQDKELAKVLQERERIKARKAKERARQKALAKKQQQERLRPQYNPSEQLMPDDAYSNPADMLPPELPPKLIGGNNKPNLPDSNEPDPYDDNYSLPVNEIKHNEPSTSRCIPEYPNIKNADQRGQGCENTTPNRPSHLNIRSTYKPRYSDPEELAQKHMSNIAMAIDPTYPKESRLPSQQNYLSPTRSTLKSQTSSSPTSSMSSSFTTPTIPEDVNSIGNAPPYMPIQGQKRTASLEKKKRRTRDGCKQQ